MKMLTGSRGNHDRRDAINILTAVDRLSMRVPTFRWRYDQLSEFPHPTTPARQPPSLGSTAKEPTPASDCPARMQADGPGFSSKCLSTSLMLVSPLSDELVVRFAPFTTALLDRRV